MYKTAPFSRVSALIGLIIAFQAVGCGYSPYNPPKPAFSGKSSMAQATVIVPTLDTPVPKGKNIVWCSTAKLAYDAFKALMGREYVEGFPPALRRLDNARVNASDLPDGSYYVAAGKAADGIAEKIRKDMAAKFPQATPHIPSGGIAMAYCYLSANVKFHHPYFDHDEGMKFADSSGKETCVSSFGLYTEHDAQAARQISVLFATGDRYEARPDEFVLDLDKTSQPSQLILASVKPRETLVATWQDVQRKIAQSKESEFSQHDSLYVPNVAFNIQHFFGEFASLNQAVFQAIDFRLDKSGALLVSESYWVNLGGIGRFFSFNRPFLIAMRKRGAAEPYFVMWVDNTELLCKPGAQ